MKSSPDSSLPEEPPGIPGFSTWRKVYWFVFVFFILCVLGLALFSRAFS